MCEWDAPEGHPAQCCLHLYAFVSYRRLSPQFQFSRFAAILVYLSQWGDQIRRQKKLVASAPLPIYYLYGTDRYLLFFQ